MSVHVVFETHSWTEDNDRGTATGWLDGCLSVRGKALARELGERRRNDNIAAVFTSDLGRAIETTEIAFHDAGIPIYRDARLRECNYGDLNGRPTRQVLGDRPRHVTEPYPHGESYLQVVDRVRSFLDELAANWQGKRVVVIGHSATRWALDHLLKGVRLEDVVAAPFDWKEGWLYVVRTFRPESPEANTKP